MKEDLNEETKCRLIRIILFIFLALLLILEVLLIRHGKQVNPDTVEVKPQKLIMGTELEELEIIPVDIAYLVYSEEISLTKIVLEFGRNIASSTIKQLETIDEYISLLEDIDSLVAKEQVNMKEFAFIYLRTQYTNSTKEIIELFGGKIKLS